MNYILQYANVSIGVIIEESCKKNFEYAKRFLETAFLFEEKNEDFNDSKKKILVNVSQYKDESNCYGKIVEVKNSKAKEFDLKAVYDEKKSIYDFINLKTVVKINEDKYELYISDLSKIALIEFFRGLVYKLIVENGGIVLHAASFISSENGKVIVGKKGAGKTTLLFHNLLDSNVEYNSGDKVVLIKKNDKLYAYGFPDYPYIGYGTIKNNIKLKQYFIEQKLPLNNKNDEKVLIDIFSIQKYWNFKINKNPFELKEIIIANISEHIDTIDYSIVLENIERYNKSSYSNWLGKTKEESLDIIKIFEENLKNKSINLLLGVI